MKENNKNNDFGLFVIRSFSLLAIIICIIILYLWQKDNSTNSKIQNELQDLVSIQEASSENNNDNIDNLISEVIILNENIIEDSNNNSQNTSNDQDYNIDVNFDILSQKNSDTVAWIAFNNLNINYPIVQAKDNSFYLTRNFYKEKNSAGWIFGDYTNNFSILDKNTIVYGHNRRNGTMFSKLTNYLNKDFCSNEDNRVFYFVTKDGKYKAQIFSAYKINAKGFTIKTNFESEIAFFDYLKQLREQSTYDFGNIVSPNDRIITLCTCDNNNQYRIVVHARLKLIQ